MFLRFLRSITAVLCLSDCAAVFVSWLLAATLRAAFDGNVDLGLYAAALPRLLIFPLLYLALGLYPGVFLRRPEELKRLTIATCTGFMVVALSFFLAKQGETYSRAVLLMAWAFSLFSVPFARHALRRRFHTASWWGYPCVVFSQNRFAAELFRAFDKARYQGLRPAVLVLSRAAQMPDCGSFAGKLEIVRMDPEDRDDVSALERLAARMPGAYAVLSMGGFDGEERRGWVRCVDLIFQRVAVIPETMFDGRIWVMAASIGDLPGLLLRQNLLDSRRLAFKRATDLALTLAGGVLISPFLLLLALAIRRDSPGPILFRQQRIGRDGKPFMVYKFRTMAADAEERLAAHLAANPEARAEWDATQKLRDDPRITRVGAFLRRTSLDELPQLINVLRDEMSLVGPRPIVEDEISRYGESFALYARVRPGMTGLWQVSGRSDIGYGERVMLDRHYICNWSLWMDIMVFIRTIPVVLCGSGAY